VKLNPAAGFDLILGMAVVVASFLPRRPQAGTPEAAGPGHWKGRIYLFFRLMGTVLIVLALLRLFGIYGTP
jgi:uncharacterized membrane protein YkgB